MTQEQYEQVIKTLHDEAHKIAHAKRPGYTQGNEDVLHNFKSSAKRLGITPMQAWGVHFDKHLQAIFSRAKCKNIPQAEDMRGRFADALNYINLGWALLQEDQKT